MLTSAISRRFKNGVPCLPLHDAVLVGKSNAAAARTALRPGFFPPNGVPPRDFESRRSAHLTGFFSLKPLLKEGTYSKGIP
jgi:hypothetical protein